MRLVDLNIPKCFHVWMIPDKDSTSVLGLGLLNRAENDEGYFIQIQGNSWKVFLRDKAQQSNINFYLNRGYAHFAEVTQIAKNGELSVSIAFFTGDIVEFGEIEIAIDDHIKAAAQRKGIRYNTIEELGQALNTMCTISCGTEKFFLLMSVSALSSDFEIETGEDKQAIFQDVQQSVADEYRAFSIVGEGLRIPVERRQMDGNNEMLFATKIIFANSAQNMGALRLARGKITFSNYSKTGRLRDLAAGAMRQLTQQTGSYLKKWDAYGAIEGEMLLDQAKRIGKITYKKTEKLQRGVRFFCSSIPEQLTVGDALELTSEEPCYISNPNTTWEEYSEYLTQEYRGRLSQKEQRKNADFYKDNNASSDTVKDPVILNIASEYIDIDLDIDLENISPDETFFVLSINGNKIQIERRMEARTAILEGRSANPLLGLLIEEDGVLPRVQRPTKLKPLTSFVKNKIFPNHPPTIKQEEAIRIALNTPDIALIQGPPGTGKTTVVTAIIERLNEEFDKTQSIRGQILVSGFQHDAVENIISRLSINALPAVKFGQKSGISTSDYDASSTRILAWSSSVVDKMREQYPEIRQTEKQLQLSNLFFAYCSCPSQSNGFYLINSILELPSNILTPELRIKAKRIRKSFEQDSLSTSQSLLRRIRALRITEVAFQDDGASRALDLLVALEDEECELNVDILEEAAYWHQGKTLAFLSELRVIKKQLLERYTPRPIFTIEKQRNDVVELCAQVSTLLQEKIFIKDRRSAILAEFLHELEDNPAGIREAIEDYNFVYAATTQQSAGKQIKKAKNKNIPYDLKTGFVTYDTVIIDEAARTSPRDLLIPMAQAEKRIILVGDHRQLPHIVNEEVVKVLEKDSEQTQTENEFVKKSMFEYLFNRLQKLQAQDSIPRTITLDAQYRTHKVLGDFVSKHFYEEYNEGYSSPLPDSVFDHTLCGIEHKPAVWISVPYSRGGEQTHSSRSKVREAEAKVIAKYIHKWMCSDQGATLSFGVISFYKAQVNAILEALKEYGITEQVDGGYQICREYLTLENGKERLRIGTVDGFQGMEFDVAFLSIVRSQNMQKLSNMNDGTMSEKNKRKLFGHLISKNRLCVSLSRQKKVLVVVGDDAFMTSPMAYDAVPELTEFYGLCKKKGIIL